MTDAELDVIFRKTTEVVALFQPSKQFETAFRKGNAIQHVFEKTKELTANFRQIAVTEP